MKKNLILMTALFAGSMIVNDGFGNNNRSGFIKFRSNNSSLASTSAQVPTVVERSHLHLQVHKFLL